MLLQSEPQNDPEVSPKSVTIGCSISALAHDKGRAFLRIQTKHSLSAQVTDLATGLLVSMVDQVFLVGQVCDRCYEGMIKGQARPGVEKVGL